MIVAELVLLSNEGILSGQASHRIRFDTLESAETEYSRISNLLTRSKERSNILPKILEVIGVESKVSLPLEALHSVTLYDFVRANEQEEGLQEAFPNLFKKAA